MCAPKVCVVRFSATNSLACVTCRQRNDVVIAVWYIRLMGTAKTRSTLNIRIAEEQRSLIDRAALVRGTSRTDFILDAARRAAEEVLLDQAFISVGAVAYAELVARLDAPARPNERLRRSLQAPSPWQKRR